MEEHSHPYMAVLRSGSHQPAAGHHYCPRPAFPGESGGKASPLVPAGPPSQKAAPPPQMPVAMAAGFMPAVFQNTSN